MCGIIGQINHKAPIDRAEFNRMRDVLHHRGPDGAGTVLLQRGSVALGHRRLSIIDLSERGRQPIANEDRSIWLTFNGEIYNYRALRAQLRQHGHTFQTDTDSETIVHAYEQWGKSFVHYLRGMFAFGIWDDNQNTLILVRDQVGIKPLYYTSTPDTFLFASELKGILAHPGIPRNLLPEAVADYLLYRFVPSPKSIWQNIFKLPPAHMLTKKGDSPPRIERYWSLPYEHQSPNEAEVLATVQELLLESTRLHLEADVPVGAFLSGGLDSSSLVRLMQQLDYSPRTFAIGFANDPKSEHESARLVADHLGLNHTQHILQPTDLDLDLVQELTWYFDEPLGGTSFLPTYLVSKYAAQELKVVMGADGGDEVFAGYPRYSQFASHLRRPWLGRYIRSMFLSRSSTDGGQACTHMPVAPGFSIQELQTLLCGAFQNAVPKDRCTYYLQYLPDGDRNSVKTLQHLDFHTFLPELYLTKVDRASMANSLEVREPFLDHRLVEYMAKLDEKTYFRLGHSKHILRKLGEKALPAQILNKPKQGFSASAVFQWLDHAQLAALLIAGESVRDGLFDVRYVRDLLERRAYKKCFSLAIFELWYQRWR